jgi:hypothetical protein
MAIEEAHMLNDILLIAMILFTRIMLPIVVTLALGSLLKHALRRETIAPAGCARR